MAKQRTKIWVEATEHPVMLEGRDRRILDPETGRDRNAIYVDDGPVEVDDSRYYRRRVMAGDLRVVDDATAWESAPDGTRLASDEDWSSAVHSGAGSLAAGAQPPAPRKRRLRDRILGTPPAATEPTPMPPADTKEGR
jgi:hypothetical protein